MKDTTKRHSKFYPTPEHYKAMNYCLKKGYKIYPKIRDFGFILVVVDETGFAQSSGKVHPRENIDEKIWQFYLYLYKKLCSN